MSCEQWSEYRSYCGHIVKCETIGHKDDAESLHLNVSKVKDGSEIESCFDLQHEFDRSEESTFSILAVQEILHENQSQLGVVVKQSRKHVTKSEYHTFLLKGLRNDSLKYMDSRFLDTSVGRHCTLLHDGCWVFLADCTSCIVLNAALGSYSVLMNSFERPVEKLLCTKKSGRDDVKSVVVFALVREESGLTLSALEICLSPKVRVQKCSTSGFIPEIYSSVLTSFHMIGESDKFLAVTSASQCLVFSNRALITCEELDLSGADVIVFLKLENPDGQVIFILQTNENEVLLLDSQTLQVRRTSTWRSLSVAETVDNVLAVYPRANYVCIQTGSECVCVCVCVCVYVN